VAQGAAIFGVYASDQNAVLAEVEEPDAIPACWGVQRVAALRISLAKSRGSPRDRICLRGDQESSNSVDCAPLPVGVSWTRRWTWRTHRLVLKSA
jgi:hypothetical protein